tara:strand:+ start:4754 stop:4930 length:177 start_codon:yes stop_codon:yes gene_type:complete
MIDIQAEIQEHKSYIIEDILDDFDRLLDKIAMSRDIPVKYFEELNIIYKQIEKIKENM